MEMKKKDIGPQFLDFASHIIGADTWDIDLWQQNRESIPELFMAGNMEGL